MDLVTALLILLIVMVTAFDFTNGFHDAADMVATAIASHAMSTFTAITLVSLFTFLGPFLVGLAVADTVGTFVDISMTSALIGESVVIAALFAAISYNLATWWLGFPSSSSNSLAGGLVGAGLQSIGTEHINWGFYALYHGELEGLMKVFAGLFVSPFMGFMVGFLILKIFRQVFRRFRSTIRSLFVVSQYFSVAWLGFSHGANDAQKGMAIIGMMLLASGHTESFSIPVWAVFLCAGSITFGTMMGGWKIIKTLGYGLFRVRLLHSFASQSASALVNTIATTFGAPTSTTQVVTASLLGTGAAENARRIKWGTAMGIVVGWFLNVPVSMGLGWLYCWILIKIIGVVS